MIWLGGAPEIIAAAKYMDRLFWLCAQRIRDGQIFDEEIWSPARAAVSAAAAPARLTCSSFTMPDFMPAWWRRLRPEAAR